MRATRVFRVVLTALAAVFASVALVPAQASAVPASYTLQSGLSPYRVLDANPATVNNNGGTVYQWAYNGGVQQFWYLYADGTIRPQANTNMCLDANPNTNWDGGTVYLWTCNGGNQQKWTYPTNGAGFSIKNVHSGRCLDVNPNTNYNGGTVYQWSCSTSPQQRWF
ncbi:hypothetical protein JOD54_004824 [Actinokineospora baliensis]|uniref:RICIN domain-containing protein n=1 Tax=Actinokineospora baliensis TaxID=547056 RepID=UPI0019572EC0|nr:RICIN domain-containing protein [Actinokineospora baliensis]MBM7774620.1 hypothetical protein [Actinokineospora baliensis]